jgi:protein ImuB
MPVAEATALAPGLQLEPYDPAADRGALEVLACWCEPFSPNIALEQDPRPECLFLDITGLEPIVGDEPALAEQLVRALAARGFVVHVGIADTPAAAWAAAHHGELLPAPLNSSFLRSCERMGTGSEQAAVEKQKHASREVPVPILSHPQISPRGTLGIVPPGETATALAELPVEALRLAPATIALLGELGLQRIGQVLSLPRASLASRFEPELIRRLDQLMGLAAETIDAYRPPPEIVAEQLLETPTARRDVLELILERLIARAVERLAIGRRGALRLECELAGSSAAPVRVDVGLYRPTAGRKHLLDLMRMRLERTRLTEPVGVVRIAVPLVAPLVCRQQPLFADNCPRHDPLEMALLIDRLSSRLGRDTVLRPVLAPDAQPEYACRYEPLVGRAQTTAAIGRQSAAGGAGRRKKISASAAHVSQRRGIGPLERPLRLESPPCLLEVISVVPEGPPVQFQWHGEPQKIARAWGPERIQTGWWRGRTIGRDYYRVETTAGTRFWLFRRLNDGAWFLHGIFE